jgi:hypothetical protein
MTFSYDPDLGDVLSRVRALLLDTDGDNPLFSDEAIVNYHALYGVDEGTVKLARILQNQYANEPSQVVIPSLRVTWADRFNAWQAIIDDVRAFSLDPATVAAASKPRRYRIENEHDPYRGRPIRRNRYPY